MDTNPYGICLIELELQSFWLVVTLLIEEIRKDFRLP